MYQWYVKPDSKKKNLTMTRAERNICSPLSLIKLAVTMICLGFFVLLSYQQYKVFKVEPVGSSLTRESMDDKIPFPAITICDYHYQNALAYKELDFPRSPFGFPKEVLSNPGIFIEKLLLLELDVVPNLWKYFFTLDDILTEQQEGWLFYLDDKCRVGKFSCVPTSLKSYENAIPHDPSQQEFEIDVEAGKWKSRFFSSSVDAKIYLCHTLKPNVTVGFAAPGDNSISFIWRKKYSKASVHRRLYVHDQNEEVLLNSFAIETVASTVVRREEDFDDFHHKKKLQIIPKLVKHPDPSDVLPCKNDTNYSENWCNIQWGWHKKIAAMKEYYGSNFTCIQPGVWDLPEDDPLPICTHIDTSRSSNNSLGYYDIMEERAIQNKDRPLMTAPSLGIYKSTSPCVRRCQLYTYSVVEEAVSMYDLADITSDVYIYFASPVVETWTEFRLMSMLDLISGVGGNIGLLLGMSLLSLVLLIMEIWRKGIKRATLSCLHSS